VDDNEAVAELITARLLSFGGRGVTGALDASTVAYRHLQHRGARALPLLEWVLEEGTPAGRAYAATLLGELDGEAGRAAWERLADESGRMLFDRGCVGSELSLGDYARSSLDGHPGTAEAEQAPPDLSTWAIDRLEHHVATLVDRRELDRARVAAQSHACQVGELAAGVRRRWAKLALAAIARLPGDDPTDRAEREQNNFLLRMWIIERLGPDGDPDWDPAALAADTLAALALDADQAGAMATGWRHLPREQIAALHRHGRLTLHVHRLVHHLPSGPARDRLAGWLGFGEQLE
jgi:hypothetical protein